MKLRDAVPADLPQMLEIYGWYVVNTAAVFEDDVPSEAEFRQRMEHIAQRYAIIAAEENGVIRGFAYAQPFSTGLCCDWSCEVCVFTAHDHRCKGIGTALTEQLIDIEKLAGMQNFYVRIPTAGEANDEHLDGAALHLAEKAGFASVGRFTKCAYKFWKWYDMLWMEKLIGESPEK